MLSRPLGYVRVAIQAWLFGATAVMDAFVVAFSVPSILQVVLLSGPLSGVLVPTLSVYRHDRRALNDLFNSVFTFCLLTSLASAGLTAVGAPLLMRLAGPGLTPDTRVLAALLFRLMLPMLVMQALLSVCKGALNALDHYGAPEYAGAVFNLVIITVALILSPQLGIVSLAIGAALGAVAQLLLQFPFLSRHGVQYRPRFRFASDLHQITALAPGAFISTVIPPVIALIDRALASLLFPGAIAALNYAFLLFLLPASLCVVPLSTVLLTDLARAYHQGALRSLRRQTVSALRLVLLLTIPVALMGALLAEPLARLVYEYGHFRAADTLRTAQALRAYLLGLPFYGTVHLLNRSFYALQDTMTPALVGLGALGLNVLGDLIFMQLFSHWGIALARTVAMLATAVALYVLFQRRCTRLILTSGASEVDALDNSNQVS
ncbi:putative lipid II flippase MurJ [Candidatus Entotheonellaceae bacterium PAL068K]